MLNDLLQWATASHEGGTELERFDVHDLLSTIFNQYNFSFLQKQNKVENFLPEKLMVVFDKNTLQFVLRNLILNANKFTERGVISVHLKTRPGTMELCVSDNGIGMTTERVNQLFDWRKRNSSPGTQGEKGAGLALLLGRDLLKKGGADLQVESQQGIGTTFSIILPLE
ncbi:MAG: sensor histidine kinase [Bacteroidota bacterium]